MNMISKTISGVFLLCACAMIGEPALRSVFADPPQGAQKAAQSSKQMDSSQEIEMVRWIKPAAPKNKNPADGASSEVVIREESVKASPGVSSGEVWTNIVPAGSYYMAIESEELAREYRFLFMSPEELKSTREYELYKDENDQFLIGIDSTLQFRAEVYCRQRGFLTAFGFELEYLQADQFKENQIFRAGWYFEFDTLKKLARSDWEFSKHGKAFEKKFKQRGFSQCPHLVFKKIKCVGQYVQQDP